MLKSHLFHVEASVYAKINRGTFWHVYIPIKLDDDVELVYRSEEIHDMMNKDYALYKNAVKHFCQVLNVPPNRVEIINIKNRMNELNNTIKLNE